MFTNGSEAAGSGQPGVSDELRAMVDRRAQIEAMQRADGNFHFILSSTQSEQRFCLARTIARALLFGHFVQAAITHFRSTEKIDRCRAACRRF